MSRNQIRQTIVSAAALLLITMGAGPASARTDAGDQLPSTTQGQTNCPLQRVDTQFVRCDNLTGNGAKAPTWIPTR
jgi:hypothetical protein